MFRYICGFLSFVQMYGIGYSHMLRCFILEGTGVVSFYYVYVGYGLLFIFILFYFAL
jgi:hypothetical protein